MSQERGRRLEAVIEVETGESVNHLEALAEWAHFSKLRAPFHLYVPSGMVDVARRLSEDNQIVVHEIWSYHAVGEDVRFALVHRTREVPAPAPVASARRAQATPAPVRNTGSTAVPRRKTEAPAAKRPARAAKGARRKSGTKKAAGPARTQKRK
jgi:hypothetical protein